MDCFRCDHGTNPPLQEGSGAYELWVAHFLRNKMFQHVNDGAARGRQQSPLLSIKSCRKGYIHIQIMPNQHLYVQFCIMEIPIATNSMNA